MSYMKATAVVAAILIIVISEVDCRPRAEIVGNHIVKQHHNSGRRSMNGNKTSRDQWRDTKNFMRIQNRNLIKSLLAFEEEYEDYEAPIIEIRFKRDTQAVANTDSTQIGGKASENSLLKKLVLRGYQS